MKANFLLFLCAVNAVCGFLFFTRIAEILKEAFSNNSKDTQNRKEK